MTEYPHVPAAFINAIADEGTKEEAVQYLQKQWNETCALRKENERLRRDLEQRVNRLERVDDSLASQLRRSMEHNAKLCSILQEVSEQVMTIVNTLKERS